tara:strand:+ start:33 stop:473 length:441 start_codon:yes stop_codon:yes gene_type:complete
MEEEVKVIEKEISLEKKRSDRFMNEKLPEINKKLDKKDYVLTVLQVGDSLMSGGNIEREVDVKRFYTPVSLKEIPEYISYMETSFWTHPDIKNPKVKSKNIPFEEKKWGRYTNVLIEPLTKELEESYLDASKKGFFKTWRMIRDSK